MEKCHLYRQGKSAGCFDGFDRNCGYLRNGIPAAAIFSKRIVYGELDCLRNYFITDFGNGGLGKPKWSAVISGIIDQNFRSAASSLRIKITAGRASFSGERFIY